MVAQFGACSSVRTGVFLTALVVTWLIWACVVRLEEKKNICKKSKFASLRFDFRQLKKIISAAKFNFAAPNQFPTQASTLPTLAKRKKERKLKQKTAENSISMIAHEKRCRSDDFEVVCLSVCLFHFNLLGKNYKCQFGRKFAFSLYYNSPSYLKNYARIDNVPYRFLVFPV